MSSLNLSVRCRLICFLYLCVVASISQSVILPSNSNYLMTCVIFNDADSNYNAETPPMGKSEEDQLKLTLSQLKETYSVNTPEVYLVYQVFSPELLNKVEVDSIDKYFEYLKETIDKLDIGVLHVLKYDQDFEKKLKCSEALIKCKSLIITEGLLQKRKRNLVCKKILKECFESTSHFRYDNYRAYDYNKVLKLKSYFDFIEEFPWLQPIYSVEIMRSWHALEKQVQCFICLQEKNQYKLLAPSVYLFEAVNDLYNAYLHEVDNTSVEQMKEISMSNTITIDESTPYLEIFRMVLLYNIDMLTGFNNKGKQSMIYKDFDIDIIKKIDVNGFELDEKKVIGLYKKSLCSVDEFNAYEFDTSDFIDDFSVIAVSNAHCDGIKLFCDIILKKLGVSNTRDISLDSVVLGMKVGFLHYSSIHSVITKNKNIFQEIIETGLQVSFFGNN